MKHGKQPIADKLLKYQKPTSELLTTPGDPGQLPVTKISGIPWWPSDVSRPYCPKYNHPMTFLMQINLADVPGCNSAAELLSLHYCNICREQGGMSYGWSDSVNRGYDVRVFSSPANFEPDSKGMIADPIIDPCSVGFIQKKEIPNGEVFLDELLPLMDDSFVLPRQEFDENVYPGFIHVFRSKLGGWPTWVQYPEWPAYKDGKKTRKMDFVGQLDASISPQIPWILGGYLYIFASSDADPSGKAEIVLQTT